MYVNDSGCLLVDAAAAVFFSYFSRSQQNSSNKHLSWNKETNGKKILCYQKLLMILGWLIRASQHQSQPKTKNKFWWIELYHNAVEFFSSISISFLSTDFLSQYCSQNKKIPTKKSQKCHTTQPFFRYCVHFLCA